MLGGDCASPTSWAGGKVDDGGSMTVSSPSANFAMETLKVPTPLFLLKWERALVLNCKTTE